MAAGRVAADLMAAGLVAAGLLAVPAPVQAAGPPPGWAQAGYGAGDTYYNPGESMINAGTINAVRRRWTVALPGSGQSCARAAEPVVADGRLYVPTETGIVAYQAGTGRLSWRFSWQSPEDESTPQLAVSGGLLIVANHGCQSQSDPDGTVRALRLGSGRLAWRTPLPAPVESLVVDRGVVVVSGESESDSPAVVGLRVADGTQLWQVTGQTSAGVSAAGRVLVNRGDSPGTSALSVTTGRVVWTRKIAWAGQAATPEGDRFYASADRNALVCLDAATGTVVWTAARRGSALIAADGRRVYRAMGTAVEALDARTGVRRWTTTLAGNAGQPVRAGGLLYTTVDGGKPLGIRNAASGTEASAGTRIGAVGGHVVVTGGWIYARNGNTLSGYAR
jgi:outer membrane protein assembly factor BamB